MEEAMAFKIVYVDGIPTRVYDSGRVESLNGRGITPRQCAAAAYTAAHSGDLEFKRKIEDSIRNAF